MVTYELSAKKNPETPYLHSLVIMLIYFDYMLCYNSVENGL